MAGGVAIVVVVVVVLPVLFLMGGAALAAILGWSLKEWGEASHPGSEQIELNR